MSENSFKIVKNEIYVINLLNNDPKTNDNK